MVPKIKKWIIFIYDSIKTDQRWRHRFIAISSAVCIWLLVSYSITATKTIPNVRIKLINIPPHKASVNLLPDGHLKQPISLTLTGQRSALKNISAKDIAVVIDASDKTDEWFANITKRELHFLNDDKNLKKAISKVNHSEYFIKLSKLVTDNVLIKVKRPIGEAPQGYQLLDTWPQELTYTITGPAEQVRELKLKGLNLTFNLNAISRGTLDAIPVEDHPFRKDEVTFFVPDAWKKINRFQQDSISNITEDIDAKNLQITFLRKNLISIDQKIPVNIFYPIKNINNINPGTYKIQNDEIIKSNNGISFLEGSLYSNNVSQLFLDVVKNNIEISIIAKPKTQRKYLEWTVQFINMQELEKNYIKLSMSEHSKAKETVSISVIRESQLRTRFRNYIYAFALYKEDGSPLKLRPELKDGLITIKDISNF